MAKIVWELWDKFVFNGGYGIILVAYPDQDEGGSAALLFKGDKEFSIEKGSVPMTAYPFYLVKGEKSIPDIVSFAMDAVKIATVAQ